MVFPLCFCHSVTCCSVKWIMQQWKMELTVHIRNFFLVFWSVVNHCVIRYTLKIEFVKIISKMSIFKETKKIFAYSGLGTDQFIQIVGTNIPRVFIRLCVVLLPMLCCVVDGVVCIKLISYRLVDGLKPFGVMVSFLPVTPIYFSLMMKTNEINDLLDYLQKVINTSNSYILH